MRLHIIYMLSNNYIVSPLKEIFEIVPTVSEQRVFNFEP